MKYIVTVQALELRENGTTHQASVTREIVEAIDPGCALQKVAARLHEGLEDDGTGR